MTINSIFYKQTQQAIGSPEDTIATDTTTAWSSISLLKAIFGKLTTGIATTPAAGGATEAKQDADAVLVGALTETAPATDTASSGLNGRLQRIAQRLTSLIAQIPATLGVKARTASLSVALSTEDVALFPASVGSKAAAASFAVTDSTEDIARIGIITETAPATDTASSGLNGRLQRIAQRITSLIALVPASLGAKTAAASFSVTLATDDALVAVQTAATATLSSLASAATSAQLLASSATRKGVLLHNTDANGVYVKYGTTASASSFTVLIPASGYWEMPRPIYTGRIDAIWIADGSGSLFATELT